MVTLSIRARRRAQLSAVGVIAALFVPAVAQASGYGVDLQSTSRAGHAGDAICEYNHGSTGCSNVGTASSTGFVSPGSGTDATAATASTFQTGVDYGQTVAESTSMTVLGDLSTASLGFASSNTNGSPASGYASGGSAQINDTLHFSVAGANSATITPITVNFTVGGTFDTTAAGTGSTAAYGEFYGALAFGASNAHYYFLNNQANGFQTAGTFSSYSISNSDHWTHNADYTEAFFTETYDLTGATSDIGFILNGNLSCQNGAICDFSKNVKASFVLPTGTAYTSDSGTFLSPVGSVPESGTWAMMLIGCGAIGAALRASKRGRRQANASIVAV